MPVLANAAERRAHEQILNRMGGVERSLTSVQAMQTAQHAAQRPISMLHGIPPPYFYGDEGEDVEAFIYALVNCANANDWKDHKTVNNLAHFLDGRAGYAFRAAVEHRVERAKGSQKERLEERRKQLKRLTELEAEKTAAGDEVRRLAALQAEQRAVKEEEAVGSGDDVPTLTEEQEKMERKYMAALELFSSASVRYAQARKEAKENDWLVGDTDDAVAKTPLLDSEHSIAFPTLASALQWLRVTFRREDVEDRLTGEYFGRRQRKGEKVQDYALELLKLCSRAGITATEAKKTQHFMDGLRPRLKRTLKHFVLSGRVKLSEGNWEETVREASKLEREHPFLTSLENDNRDDYVEVNAVAARPAAGDAQSVTTTTGKATTVDWNQLALNVAALTTAVQAGGDRPGKERNNETRALICYNCHELGHYSWQCPKEDSGNTRNFRAARPQRAPFDAVCYGCNQKGHFAATCPTLRRLAEAKQRAPPATQARRQAGVETKRGGPVQGSRSGNGPRA